MDLSLHYKGLRSIETGLILPKRRIQTPKDLSFDALARRRLQSPKPSREKFETTTRTLSPEVLKAFLAPCQAKRRKEAKEGPESLCRVSVKNSSD